MNNEEIINQIVNSEHSETIADILIGVGYISFMAGMFFLTIWVKGS